eukprot:3886467-Pyramimonas_sp.AAC.1
MRGVPTWQCLSREGVARSHFHASRNDVREEIHEGAPKRCFRSPGGASHSRFYAPQELSRAWTPRWVRASLALLRAHERMNKIAL